MIVFVVSSLKTQILKKMSQCAPVCDETRKGWDINMSGVCSLNQGHELIEKNRYDRVVLLLKLRIV